MHVKHQGTYHVYSLTGLLEQDTLSCHPCHKPFLSTYYMPSTLLGLGDSFVSKNNKRPFFLELTFQLGLERQSKQNI